MEQRTACALAKLTRAFYEAHASSFGATRERPWQGWERLAPLLRTRAEAAGRPLRVLDVGCGNLRFERFLAERGIPFEAWCADACEPLMSQGSGALAALAPEARVHLQATDVVDPLLEGASPERLAAALGAPACDAAVAFGVLHHVPGTQARMALLQAMAACVASGGLVVVSLWRFADDPRLLAKAHAAMARGKALHDLGVLEPNDYLLGWQDDERALRYCHHFDEAEADALACALEPMAHETARFSADGRSSALNRYLVLERL